MPTTLTGVTTGIADGQAASVATPADGDALNAASLSGALQYLLNRAKYLLNYPTLAHTWSAVQTFSAANVFSGTNSFSGVNTFSAANVFSVAQAWNALQTFTAGLRVSSAADATPQIESTRFVTGNRQIIGQFATVSGAPKIRLYAEAAGVFSLTWNCLWNPAVSTTDYVADVSGPMAAVTIASNGIHIHTTLSGVAGVASPLYNISLLGHNLASNDGLSRALAPLNMLRAWALIRTDGAGGFQGTNQVLSGANIGSCTFGGGGGTDIIINFATGLSDNYCGVQALASQGGPKVPYVVSADANSVIMRVYAADHTTVIDPTANVTTLHVWMTGRQT